MKADGPYCPLPRRSQTYDYVIYPNSSAIIFVDDVAMEATPEQLAIMQDWYQKYLDQSLREAAAIPKELLR